MDMNKMGLQRGDKRVVLSNLRTYYTRKNIKISYRKSKCKISGQHGMKKLNCPIDLTLCNIFKINSNRSSKSMKHWLTYHQSK